MICLKVILYYGNRIKRWFESGQAVGHLQRKLSFSPLDGNLGSKKHGKGLPFSELKPFIEQSAIQWAQKIPKVVYDSSSALLAMPEQKQRFERGQGNYYLKGGVKHVRSHFFIS